jgi:hypothetical protein
MKLALTGIPGRLYKYSLVLFCVVLLVRILLAGYYNNNLGGIEPNVVYGIQRILAGLPLYQSPSSGSYAVIQYTPAWYYFVAAIAKPLGIRALDVQSIFVLCRGLALLFNLLTIVIAALIIRTWRFSYPKSLMLASPLLMLLTTHYFTRGDSMHLFFFVAALYAYVVYADKKQLPYIIICALLSAICIMVKQSGILVAGIIMFHLLFAARKYAAAFAYAAGTFIFAFMIAWLSANSNWPAMYQNAVLGLKSGLDLSFLYNMFIGRFYYELVPCYLLGGIIVYLALKRIKDPTFQILATGIALSWLFAVTTGIKIGSSNNYFTEFLVCIVLCLPFLFEYAGSRKVLLRLVGYEVTIHQIASIAFFILITSKATGLFTAVFIEKRIKDESTEYAREEALYSYFKDNLLIGQGEHIYFTERYFLDNIFMQYSIMPIKDVVSQTYLCDRSTYNYSAFIAGMNSGLVKYIVTDEKKRGLNLWHKEIPFILFDKNKFSLLTDTAGYSIYVYSGG